MAIAITNRTRNSLAALPWATAAQIVLGAQYDLSLVFLGKLAAARLNQRCRGVNHTPNVLSWPLSPQSGEIVLVPAQARREAPTYGHAPHTHLFYLFIHGLLHLKGFEHGSKMEREEKRLLAIFRSNEQTHHRRTRHRHERHPRRRG